MNNIYPKRLSPILKWPGGKEQELKFIHPLLPKQINQYYEPFIGGGAVYFSIQADSYHINDKSEELINLYKAIQSQDEAFFDCIQEIIKNWNLLEQIVKNNNDFFINMYKKYAADHLTDEEIKNIVSEFVIQHSKEFNGMLESDFNVNINNFLYEINKNITSKSKRMKKIEKEKGQLPDSDIIDNIESSLKSAFYMHFRYLYNHTKKYAIEPSKEVAIFFFIRNFAYSGMFRYNKSGHFNVPYGGIGYNRKNIAKKITGFQCQNLVNHLQKTHIKNTDFSDFLQEPAPQKNDFIFLDPPYDSDFSTYAKNTFDKQDQKRLANYLINDCQSNWMLVIKNTDYILDLYSKANLDIQSFNKKYLVSFQNRNDKNAEHLIIRNYNICS